MFRGRVPGYLTRTDFYPTSGLLKTLPLALLSSLLAVIAPVAHAADPLVLKSGDSIVLIGNTVIERAQKFGHLETALTLAAGPEVDGLKFRNLGWSGDSVYGDARSYFGAPEEGRERLKKAITETAPSVAFLCYGTGAAMSTNQGWTGEASVAARSAAGDEASLALFIEGYGKLLDLVEAGAGEGLREIVILSPPPLENLGVFLPDQTENNRRLGKLRDAVKALAETRGHRFVDLFAAMGGDAFDGGVTETPLTDNGVHYGDAGYRAIARQLIDGLGLSLPEGLLTTDARVEEMRDAIVKKNRLFFHRWRPANETYLFLFRKHEQGQNAREIPLFDPLIAGKEREIGDMRAAIFEDLKKR